MMITKESTIEELVNNFPFAVEVLSVRGIRCIRCGEPVWGTLEEAAKEKGYDDDYISTLVKELNDKILRQ